MREEKADDSAGDDHAVKLVPAVFPEVFALGAQLHDDLEGEYHRKDVIERFCGPCDSFAHTVPLDAEEEAVQEDASHDDLLETKA